MVTNLFKTDCKSRFHMALTHRASSGTGSAWIYCPHNENWSCTFKSFKSMTSGLLQNSAEKSFRHLSKVSCLAEEWRVWPHKLPQSCFHLGQGKQYSHVSTPACVLTNQQRCLPHHIWHSCISSGSAGWFEEDLPLLDTQREPVVKTTIIFTYHSWQSKCAEP